jgi:hypothetical protein
MPAVGLVASANSSRAHFQIFTSGLAARHTLLVDSDAGRTCVLASGKRKAPNGTEYDIVSWQPFDDE